MRLDLGLLGERHRPIADRRDVAGRDACPGPQERVKVTDVVSLDDEVGRVLREGKPIAVDLDVLGLAIE